MRQFEFPYNFDRKLIEFLYILDPQGKTINCIYLPPFLQDYQTILRSGEQADYLNNLTRQEYEDHLNFINNLFPGKIQILLQKQDSIMGKELIEYYRNLNISKFCAGSYDQAQLIKDIDKNINVVGSITMQINLKELIEKKEQYKNVFDSFVLTFKHSRNLEEIKKLPRNFSYILLINSFCNKNCGGKQHWNYNYKDQLGVKCPGIYSGQKSKVSWENCALIRPMDLGFFDPYIDVYKLQDRGWPTSAIIRDYILYTTNYDLYPNIIYNEDLYYGK